MLFNSVEFLIFLPVVFLLYWFVFKKSISYQNILLLAASYLFYAWWDWRFLFLLVFSTALDYFTGIQMNDSKDPKRRRFWFLLSVIINLGFLGVFKYYDFFVESLKEAVGSLGIHVNLNTLNIILPVGISFYTFHGLSYVIDIYKEKIEPERNIVTYSLFVSFFPLLVAGPIERATHLLPQIKRKRFFTDLWFKEGVVQMAVGFFRKMVIADSLAVYVDEIYGNPSLYNGTSILMATVFYAFQIYFDFSGYSDIAIGTAKLFGFELKENFNLPYFSKSITEFWRRWHMSLSFWLRDYLYISLGGNRKGIRITYRNLMITMLLGGLWHGSSWNFVIWGGIHGLALSIEKFVFDKLKIKDFGLLGALYTFGIVIIAWVFFRSKDLSTSSIILSKIFSTDYHKLFIGDINVFSNSVFMLMIGMIIDSYMFATNVTLEKIGAKFNTFKFIAITALLILLIVLFYSNSNNFIYFQF